MKTDLTGLSTEARILFVERYMVGRLQTRNGGTEDISAEDLIANFKCRDIPPAFADIRGTPSGPGDPEAPRGPKLPPHKCALAYYGKLLNAAIVKLRARETAARIIREGQPKPAEASQ